MFLMVYIFTGKQHRMRQNNDIYITSEMALVSWKSWKFYFNDTIL